MLGVAMAEEEKIQKEQDLDFETDPEEPEGVPLKKGGATARTWEWGKKLAKWMGYDYDDPVQYEGHHVQAAGGHHVLAPVGATGAHGGSSYVSYQAHPGPFAHSPARDDYIDEDEWSFTDMIFDMAVTVVPIGLLLAALPSGLFTFAVRRRSLGDNSLFDDSFDADELPILKDLMENDWLAFTARECQERLFCEISQLGEKEESSPMQKLFYYTASLTPDFVARKVGLSDVFRASRYKQCEIFRCGPSLPEPLAPVSNDLAPPTTNDTEADLTEPIKE